MTGGTMERRFEQRMIDIRSGDGRARLLCRVSVDRQVVEIVQRKERFVIDLSRLALEAPGLAFVDASETGEAESETT